MDIHLRIVGYTLTLVMHTANVLVTNKSILEGMGGDPDVIAMKAMEDTFFTVWNVGFQMAYAAFSLYCDIRSLTDQKNKKWAAYLKYRKTFFSAILWPSTMFVFTVFWPIFLYDRSVIFPKFIDRVLSKTSNLIIHAAIVPVAFWELWFLPIEVPRSNWKNLGMISSLYVVYISWIFYIRSVRQMWPYPILLMLEGTIFLPLFLSAAYVVLIFHYFSQWYLRRRFERTERSIKTS